MTVDLNDASFVRQTTSITAAADYIAALISDDNDDVPFELAEGDQIQVIITRSGDTPPTLNNGIEIASGTVPASATWTLTPSWNIKQEPPQ